MKYNSQHRHKVQKQMGNFAVLFEIFNSRRHLGSHPLVMVLDYYLHLACGLETLGLDGKFGLRKVQI